MILGINKDKCMVIHLCFALIFNVVRKDSGFILYLGQNDTYIENAQSKALLWVE